MQDLPIKNHPEFGLTLSELGTRHLASREAVATIANWRFPVLFIHGDDDPDVPFQQTTDLVEKLREQEVAFEELIIPDEIHDLLR